MNLFYLDEDHATNAQYHADKHCVKMILEAAQLICTTFHLQNIEAPYRATHKNHPSAIWTRQSRQNLEWVINYATSLADEYTYRYGKQHKSSRVVSWAQDKLDLLKFPSEGITEFALAMPDEYKTSDPVESYRNYYRGAKKHLHSWKKRAIPSWL